MHARRGERYGDRKRDVWRELRDAGFSRDLVKASVRMMTKLVEGWRRIRRRASGPSTGGSTPTRTPTPTPRPGAPSFGRPPGRGAAPIAGLGPRLQRWAMPVSLLRRARAWSRWTPTRGRSSCSAATCAPRATSGCLALTVNVIDSSPGLGWRGEKRRPLLSRGRPELVLCLALVDHVTITVNVPMRAWIHWLAVLGAWLVIEFRARDDQIVERLLAARKEGAHADYERAAFGRCLGDVFEVERSASPASGTRVLYLAHPRGRPAAA
jgi:hypothetical protein